MSNLVRPTQQMKSLKLEKVANNFVDPLLDAVLIDYRANVPSAREPEVLSTMASIVSRLGSLITPKVPKILDAVFECTLEMINKNFEEFPGEFISLRQLSNLVS